MVGLALLLLARRGLYSLRLVFPFFKNLIPNLGLWYLPFVVFCAILLPWWEASMVALAAVPILGLSFIGTPAELAASSCFQSSSGIFLAASAGMICLVAVARRVFVAIQRSGADESAGGVLFSLDDGKVWASWYGRGPRVLLGSEDKVSVMMADFLAQGEVAKRLSGDRK